MAFVESLRARNVLSFGDEGLEVELRDLNVIIGANGTGKSNLVSLFSLLRAAPTDISRPFISGGGIQEWLWKGGHSQAVGEIEVRVGGLIADRSLYYKMGFRETAQRFQLVEESVDEILPGLPRDSSDLVYHLRSGESVSRIVENPYVEGERRYEKVRETLAANQSVLSQRRSLEYFPEITSLASAFSGIRIFQDWQFGHRAAVRNPQPTDLPTDYLLEDASNLALVINDLEFDGQLAPFGEFLQVVSPAYLKLKTRTAGGSIQLFVEEADLVAPTPATRLSQGTLQILCLLSILLHPKPPKLVCIEEPEKGLHPDILPEIAKLLRRASERMQVIVTTHSDILVDALTDEPESVLVCEKERGSTRMRRLDARALASWLAEYRSLGAMWRSGLIGGNRW